ncbi:hypothetical protein [Pseudomonas sp. PNPG3]|uniref:hypothetical protein n=1 Tax=Pseudomonas sp. PNPG3 TaxID=2919497 RepID=UPI001FFD7CD0|nr:hypothetical protein [Pseudomonas sp. PNPG3]MCK2123864.1 hypothetical protein [Pseudomonas sp. PNPG3]
MPTENRSSNTDPRDVFIRLNPLGLGEAELRKDSTGFEDQRTHSDYLLFLAGYRETHPAPQPHPEPIAWMVGTAFWWTREEAERDAAATGLPIVGLGPMAANTTVQQHQGQPVAVEGATFMGEPNFQHSIEWYREGISKHWKKICDLRAEVERLRTELDLRTQEREKFLGWCRDARAESTKLRAQLAERDALLQEIRRKPGLFSGDFILRLDETLSASAEPRPFRTPDCPDCACVQDGQCLCSPSKPSAEPSAPVEIDERADFERHVILTTGRPIDSELKRHPVRHDEYECRTMQTRWNDWQARAALDRKPS